jgi:hypothetical protein
MLESSKREQIQECRAKAIELREHAATMHASDFRQQVVDIAHQYERLADDIERTSARK